MAANTMRRMEQNLGERMSTDSRSEFFIIEALNLDDEKADAFEGHRIKRMLDLSGKNCEYIYIRTERELHEILKEFERSRYGSRRYGSTYDPHTSLKTLFVTRRE
jgi:hypothetical protein